jgi:hypothetical protein
VRSLAVAGSKFEGTGFEKVHIGQIQVAVRAGEGSGTGRWKGLSERERGEAVALLVGVLRLDRALFCIDARFEGFGTSVNFAEDFRKPAYAVLDVTLDCKQ